jgi:hypothetical protein
MHESVRHDANEDQSAHCQLARSISAKTDCRLVLGLLSRARFCRRSSTIRLQDEGSLTPRRMHRTAAPHLQDTGHPTSCTDNNRSARQCSTTKVRTTDPFLIRQVQCKHIAEKRHV